MQLFRMLPALACALFSVVMTAQDKGAFYLHDGDRVVFYGDSITAQKLYTVYTEIYVRALHPEWKIEFLNAGVGGDRVDGGGAGKIDERLSRDVIARKPTVVTVMLGMNDRATEATRKAYTPGYEHILDRLTKELPEARLTLIGPSPLDDVTRPEEHGNANLVGFSTTVQELAQRYHALFVDLNAPGIAGLKRSDGLNHAATMMALPDRVHPEGGFHLLMAETLLRAWNYPGIATMISIDAHDVSGTRGHNPAVHTITANDGGLQWEEEDAPDGHFWPPIEGNEVMNRLLTDAPHLGRRMLQVNGLEDGQYNLEIDGKSILKNVSSKELAAGVDLLAVASPMHDQGRTIYWACSNSESLQTVRTSELSHLKSAAPDAAAEGARFLDAAVGAAGRGCQNSAKRVVHKYVLMKAAS